MSDGTDTEAWVEDFLSDLIEFTDLDINIEELILDDNDVLTVHLAGQDSARAIGRDGQVLEAFQHIVIAAAIRSGVPRRRIVIDIERYRQRREQRVREDASHFAREALNTGRAQDLAPMSPRERRLVHMTVADIDGVTTESRGEGDERYVRVVPQ